MKKINNIKCTTLNYIWSDPKLFTSDAKRRINFEVAFIGKLIETREKRD
ncbi:MAG: hypothetical protein LE169_00240 [Endomicrobium sp.]|jgi:hypothetical protein|nr:hypothetical protein [Endomicrobium sp.]